jgi:hypothetical protein
MLKLNERNIFLVDGIGASLSAIFTGILLPLVSEWVGLPSWLLYNLALFPIVFGIFSFVCYFKVKTIKPILLLMIITANLIYCAISFAICNSFSGITIWGKIFLLSEIPIILIVVALEIKVYLKTFSLK